MSTAWSAHHRGKEFQRGFWKLPWIRVSVAVNSPNRLQLSECRKVTKNKIGLKSGIRAGFAVHPLDLFQATYRKTLRVKVRCEISETVVQFVVATFDTEPGAEETLLTLQSGKKEKLHGVQGAVAMRKDSQGQIHYKDVGLTPAKGALAGVVMGAVVGIATGGAGLVLGAVGALFGGVIGKRRREGQVSAEQVNQVVASLPKGASALLAIVEQQAAPAFETLLQDSGAQTFTADISADLAAQLSEHAEVAHAALVEQLK